MKEKMYQAGMFSIILIFGIFATSCVTKMGVYNTVLQTIEPDQLCHLTIDTRVGISGIDGKPVSLGIARQPGNTKISIPAGLHSFRFEFFEMRDNGTSTSILSATNFVFSYDFVAGHEYKINAGMGGRTVVVYVRDKTDKKLSKTITLKG